MSAEYWEIVRTEDGEITSKCPCGSLGTIVEQDFAIRWNTLSFNDDGTAVAYCGDEGDYDFEKWYCTACGKSPDAPEGFEILDWL